AENQDSIRREGSSRSVERVLGEKKTFEPQIRDAGSESERIRQREDDEIVLPDGIAEKNAAIVVHQLDARIGIRPIGVQLRAELLNDRIDLDGGDLLHVVGECCRRIGAGPCAENERVLKLRV